MNSGMKKWAVGCLVGAASLWSAVAMADPANALLEKIHQVNQMEIQMGQLAEKNAAAKEVKDYAKELVRDHQKADKDVMSLAKDQKVTLTESAGDSQHMQMKEEGQQKMQQLQGIQGAQFDRMFLTNMVQDHQKVISMLTDERGEHAADPQVSQLVAKLVPQLKVHQKKAEQLLTRVGSNQARRTPPK